MSSHSFSLTSFDDLVDALEGSKSISLSTTSSSIRLPHLLLLLSQQESHSIPPLFSPSSSPQNEERIPIFSQTPGAFKRRFREVASRVIRVLRQYKKALKFIQDETGNENIPKQIDVDEIRQDISIQNGPTRFFAFLRKCFFQFRASAVDSDATSSLALLASLVRTLASFVVAGSSLGNSALCEDGFALMLDLFISFSSSRTGIENNNNNNNNNNHTSIIIDSSAAYILYCLKRTSNSEQDFDFTFSSQQSQMFLNFCLGEASAQENKQGKSECEEDEGLSLLLPSNTSFLNVTAANNNVKAEKNNIKQTSSSTISFETLSLLTEWFRIQPSCAFTAISSFVANNNNDDDDDDQNSSKGGFIFSMLRNVIQKQLRNFSSSPKINNNNNFFAESCWKFAESVLSGVFNEIDDEVNQENNIIVIIFETIWECLILEQNAYFYFHDPSALQATFTRIVFRILPTLLSTTNSDNESGIIFNTSFLAGILHTVLFIANTRRTELNQDFCNLVCEILENGTPTSSSSSSSSEELYAQFKICLELLLQAFDPQTSSIFGPSHFCTQVQHQQHHRKRRHDKEHQRSTTIVNDSSSTISDRNENNNSNMMAMKLILTCSSVFWKQYDRYRGEELPHLLTLESKQEEENNRRRKASNTREGRNTSNRNDEEDVNTSRHESIGRSASQEAIDSALRRREFDLSQIISENHNSNNSQISNDKKNDDDANDNNDVNELSPIREIQNNNNHNHVDDISSKKYLLVPSLILLESQCRLLLDAVSEVSASENRKLEEDDIFVHNNNNNNLESNSTSVIMMNLISLIDNVSRGCLIFLGSFDVDSDHNINRDSKLKFKVICKIAALSLYSLLKCSRELSSATVSSSGKKHRSTLTNVVALALEQSYLILLQLTSANSKKGTDEIEDDEGEKQTTSKNPMAPTLKDILCQMTEIAPLMISAATSVYALSQQRQNFSLLLSSADDFLNSLQAQASEVFTAEVLLDEARRFLEVQPLYKLQGPSFVSSEMDDVEDEEGIEEIADDAFENHNRNNNNNNNNSKNAANSSRALLSNSSYCYISMLKNPMKRNNSRSKNPLQFFNARIIDSTTCFLLEKALLCEPNGCEFERDRLNLFNIMSIAAQHPETLSETFCLCDKIMRRMMSSLPQQAQQQNNLHHDSSMMVTLLMELLRFQFKRSFELSSVVISTSLQPSLSEKESNTNNIQEIIQELFSSDYETLLPLISQLLAESHQQHFFASLVHAFAFLVCYVHENDSRCLDSLCKRKKLLHGDLPKLLDFLNGVSATDETKKAIQILMENMKKYYSEFEPNNTQNTEQETNSSDEVVVESSFIILDLQAQIKSDSISRTELEERSALLIEFYKTRNENNNNNNGNSETDIQQQSHSHQQPSKSSRGVVGTIRQLKEDVDDEDEEVSPIRNQEDDSSDKVVPSPHTRPSTAAAISPLPKHAKIVASTEENDDDEKDDRDQKQSPPQNNSNNNNSAILDEEYSLLRHETIQDQRKALRIERQELANEKQASDHLLRQIDGAIQKLQSMVDEHSAERYHSQKFGDRTRMLEEEQHLVASQRSKTKDTECRVLRSLLQKRSAALMELDSGLELQQSLQHPMRMLVFAVNHKCQQQEEEIAKLSSKVRKQEENSSVLRHRTDGVRLHEHDEMQRKLAAMEIELDHAKKQLTMMHSSGQQLPRGITTNNNNINNSRPATASPQRLSARNVAKHNTNGKNTNNNDKDHDEDLEEF